MDLKSDILVGKRIIRINKEQLRVFHVTTVFVPVTSGFVLWKRLGGDKIIDSKIFFFPYGGSSISGHGLYGCHSRRI